MAPAAAMPEESFSGFDAAAPAAERNVGGTSTPKRVKMVPVNGFTVDDLGSPCIVTGFGSGTIRFVGYHAIRSGEQRIGVEMDEEKGKRRESRARSVGHER